MHASGLLRMTVRFYMFAGVSHGTPRFKTIVAPHRRAPVFGSVLHRVCHEKTPPHPTVPGCGVVSSLGRAVVC